MPKRKKKYKIKSHELTAKRNLRASLAKVKWKLIGKLILVFAVVWGIFQAAIYFKFGAIYIIYAVALLVVFAMFAYFNHGFSHDIPTREELIIPEEEKDAFLEKVVRDRAFAKKLLLILIPLILTFIIDIIYVLYIDGMFSLT